MILRKFFIYGLISESFQNSIKKIFFFNDSFFVYLQQRNLFLTNFQKKISPLNKVL